MAMSLKVCRIIQPLQQQATRGSARSLSTSKFPRSLPRPCFSTRNPQIAGGSVTCFARRHESTASTVESQTARSQSTTSNGKPLTEQPDHAAVGPQLKANEPAYQLTFTCRKCLERSERRVSKQGYHHGTVLITCPGCKNRHLISDHLKIFSDTSVTLEDILKEKGQLIKKGVLGADGDVEFWAEGAQSLIGKPTTKDGSEG